MIYHHHHHFLFFATLLFLANISCNKKFDVPPVGADPDIPVNMTIDQLKSRYSAIGRFQGIDEDKTIAGIVTANDQSGNFYKQIVIQDSTGAISVLLDGSGLYTAYPVGRKVFVKLKGMMLGDYGGTIQLGLDSTRSADGRFLNVGAVPVNLFDAYLVKGSFGNRVQPKTVTVEELNKITTNVSNPLQSMLVQIEDLQFAVADTTKTYADPAKMVSAVNYTVRNCNNKGIVLRSSSYANFAGIKIAGGNGTITGISSVFNSTVQISIRDTADVRLNNVRCNDRPASVKTIAAILKYAAGDSVIPPATILEGVLISDTKNEAAGNYRFQDETGGILLKFSKPAEYPVNAVTGEKYQVNVSGARISVFNGGVQVTGMGAPVKTGTGAITTHHTTTSAIAVHVREWESTLIRLSAVTVNKVGNATGGANYMIRDTTGEISSFVRTGSGISMPLKADSIIGYVSAYLAIDGKLMPQFTLRKQEDIYGGVFTAPSSGGGIELGNISPRLISFDDIGNGLPAGIKVVTNAGADTIGREAVFAAVPGTGTQWTNATGGFKNFASATGLLKTADANAQASAVNRALGIRQVSTADAGVSFVFIINNTTGKNNLQLDFLLQSLDGISAPGRTTTWVLEYGVGENPEKFTAIPTTPAILATTLGVFSSIVVHAGLPAALNNNQSKIWIRLVTHTAATGTGSRPSSAIDDFKISW